MVDFTMKTTKDGNLRASWRRNEWESGRGKDWPPRPNTTSHTGPHHGGSEESVTGISGFDRIPVSEANPEFNQGGHALLRKIRCARPAAETGVLAEAREWIQL